MPLYEYFCKACDEHFERLRAIACLILGATERRAGRLFQHPCLGAITGG